MYSQKHTGLILVPWFNSEEWRYVYNLIYSNDMREHHKALEILKIWKTRTSILSAGIEGTLTLLDATQIQEHSSTLGDQKCQQIYSVALVRFLNLCAAMSDKQGSFNKTAKKHDLPKWLIDMRHDIAHGHNLPSKSMLEMGIKYGLDWLKDNYWDPTSINIKDYEVEATENDKDKTVEVDNCLKKTIKQYITVKCIIYDKKSIKRHRKEIDKLLPEHQGSITDPQTVAFLEESIRTNLYLLNSNNSNVGQIFANLLVLENWLLRPNFEQDDEGVDKIQLDFKNIWAKLLNILNECKLLFSLIDRLFDATGDISLNPNSRKMASLWLCEIFFSLFITKMIDDHVENLIKSGKYLKKTNNMINIFYTKLKDQPGFKEYIVFNTFHAIYLEEARRFTKKVFHLPNEFTLNFLQILMKYANYSDDYIQDSVTLIQDQSSPVFDHRNDKHICTMDDLTEILPEIDYENVYNSETDITQLEDTQPMDVTNHSDYLKDSNLTTYGRWKCIKDTTAFHGCPIGVLPHQNRNGSLLVEFYQNKHS